MSGGSNRYSKRKQVRRPDLPLPVSMPSGSTYVSRATLFDAIGWGPHECFWCRREVDWLPRGDPRSLQADHLDADVLNDDLANLVPSCGRCNTTRGGGTLWFLLRDEPLANLPEILRWGPIRSTFACGHPISERTVYRPPSKGFIVCLTCHRERAREQWRATKQGAS